MSERKPAPDFTLADGAILLIASAVILGITAVVVESGKLGAVAGVLALTGVFCAICRAIAHD